MKSVVERFKKDEFVGTHSYKSVRYSSGRVFAERWISEKYYPKIFSSNLLCLPVCSKISIDTIGIDFFISFIDIDKNIGEYRWT